MKKQSILLGLFGLFSMLYGQAEGECISGATRLDKSELYPDQMIIWGCSKGEWVALSEEDNAENSMIESRIQRWGDDIEKVYQKLASDKEVGATYIALDRHLVSKSGTDTYTILRNWNYRDRLYRTSLNGYVQEFIGKVIYDENSGDFYVSDYIGDSRISGEKPGWNRLNNYSFHDKTGEYKGRVRPCSYYSSERIYQGFGCKSSGACPSYTDGTVDIKVQGKGRTKKLALEDAETKYKKEYEDANYKLWSRTYSDNNCRSLYLRASTQVELENYEGKPVGNLILGWGDVPEEEVMQFLNRNKVKFSRKAKDKVEIWRYHGLYYSEVQDRVSLISQGLLTGYVRNKETSDFMYIAWK